MKNTSMNFDSAKFGAVWQRVSQNPCAPAAALEPCAGGEEIELLRLIDITSQNEQLCRRTAARCSGKISRVMQNVAASEHIHTKKLRAKYYILTGATYCPTDTCSKTCSMSESLLNIFRSEGQTATDFFAAADTAKSTSLAQTYRQIARDEERNAEMISCLIEGMLC